MALSYKYNSLFVVETIKIKCDIKIDEVEFVNEFPMEKAFLWYPRLQN